MVFSLWVQPAFAQEGGLCQHHREHTKECGYREGKPGHACSHEHQPDCYTLVTRCVHRHDQDCYPQEDLWGSVATPSNSKKRRPENCSHVCSQESGCIREVLNCPHKHGEDCGYVPAQEETPCGYVCSQCESSGILEETENAAALKAQPMKAAGELDSGDFGSGFHWVLDDDGLLAITGTGDMPDWNPGAPPWSRNSYVEKISVSEGITSIGNNTFMDIPYATTAELPDSLTSIGEYAFGQCIRLEQVKLPANLTSIGNNAFEGCTRLALEELPANVTSIGEYAFEKCTSLALTELPANLTSIGSRAFQNCTSLALTGLPAGVTTIERRAFYKCTNLALTELPAGVTSIGLKAFYGCTGLEQMKFPDSLNVIEESAFEGCENLRELTFTSNPAPNLESDVFSLCDALTAIYVPAGAAGYDSGNGWPADKVVLLYPAPQPVRYSVSVNGSYAPVSGEGSYEAGELVPIYGGSRESYRFGGWSSPDGVSFADPENAATTFIMPDKAVTVTADWIYIGESAGGGSSGSGGESGSGSGSGSGGSSSSGSSGSGGGSSSSGSSGSGGGSSGSGSSGSSGGGGSSGSGFSTAAGTAFTDVKETDWFYQDVQFVCQKGLMSGAGGAAFAPDGAITRIQVAEILYSMEGSPKTEEKNCFTDVERGPGTMWSYDSVTWAEQKGMISGIGNGKFGPGDLVTRGQLAEIFYRYARYKGYDVRALGSLDRFPDKDKVLPGEEEALIWAVESNMIKELEDNQLSPRQTVTRAQMAAMLRRFIDKYEKKPV